MANKEATTFKPTDITVRDFLAEYREAVRDSLKRRSFENVRDVICLHLIPEFGRRKLKDLTRERVQKLSPRR